MRMRSIFTGVSFMAIMGVAMTDVAHAGSVVYSQGPLFGAGNSFPAEINGGQQADDWVASSATQINVFRWWGTQPGSGPNDGSFTLRVFSNSGGMPGSLLNSFAIGNSYSRINTGQSDSNGRDIYQYDANIGAFNPIAGVTYWLSIVNDSSISGSPIFLWHQGSGPNNLHAFRFQTGSWNSLDGDMAFELVSIPTPGALALLAMAAIGGKRRRR